MSYVVVGHFASVVLTLPSFIRRICTSDPGRASDQFAPAETAAPSRTRMIDRSIFVADVIGFAHEPDPYPTEESDGPGHYHQERPLIADGWASVEASPGAEG